MGIATAVNLSSNTSQAVKSRYYKEVFLARATSNLVHSQLGQLNVQIPSGQGGYGTGVVYWTRFINLPVVSAGQGEGVPTTAVVMTAVNVTGSTAQYDAAVSISDILKYSSFGDIMKQATDLLGYNAGLSIDTIVRDAIAGNMTIRNATSAGSITAIPVTGTISVTEIRKATRTLQRNDAIKPDGGFWISVIHPDALYKFIVALYREVYRKFRELGGTLNKIRQYLAELSLEIKIEGVETMYGTPRVGDDIGRSVWRHAESSRNIWIAL